MVVTAVMVVSDSECSTTLPQLARRSGLACILTAGRAGGTDDHHNDETAALYGIISIYCSLVFVYLSFDSIICALLLVPRDGVPPILLCHTVPARPTTLNAPHGLVGVSCMHALVLCAVPVAQRRIDSSSGRRC